MAEQHSGAAVGGRGGGGKKRKKKKKTPQSVNPTQSLPPQLQLSPTLLLDYKAPLRVLLKTLSVVIHQVRDEEPKAMLETATDAPAFPPVAAFQKAAGLVSNECTKLATLFSSAQTTSSLIEVTTMGCLMEKAIIHFVNAYHHISPIYGVALQREVQRCALPMLRGVESLINDIITTGTITVQHGLRNTGSVWEYAERAAKLSKDNKAAVVKELLSQLHLIRDGYREAMEIMAVNGKGEGWREEGVNKDVAVSDLSDGIESVELDKGEEEEKCVDSCPREWNEREKNLAELCIDLIKLCNEVTNDLCGVVVRDGCCSIDNRKTTHELDQTLAIVLELSPLIDELVGEIPAPLLWPDCKEAGERLALTIFQLLHTIRPFHFCKSSEKWMKQYKTYSTILSSIKTQLTTF